MILEFWFKISNSEYFQNRNLRNEQMKFSTGWLWATPDEDAVCLQVLLIECTDAALASVEHRFLSEEPFEAASGPSLLFPAAEYTQRKLASL